jgi:hypothetical protein
MELPKIYRYNLEYLKIKQEHYCYPFLDPRKKKKKRIQKKNQFRRNLKKKKSTKQCRFEWHCALSSLGHAAGEEEVLFPCVFPLPLSPETQKTNKTHTPPHALPLRQKCRGGKPYSGSWAAT